MASASSYSIEKNRVTIWRTCASRERFVRAISTIINARLNQYHWTTIIDSFGAEFHLVYASFVASGALINSFGMVILIV